MPNTLLPIDAFQFTRKNLLQAVLVNAVVNTLIAVFLTVIGFSESFLVAFIFSQCIGMSIFFSSLLAIPLYKRLTSMQAQLALIVVTILSGSVLGTLLGMLANGFHPVQFIQHYFGLFSRIVFLGLVFGSIMSFIFISLGRLAAEKVKRLEGEKDRVEAELKLLQSQMEPHFLFNTLSNVLSLIETDAGKAHRMLESFTSFLRSSFVTARQRTVTLGQEIDVINSYLAVLSIRMGGRLRYHVTLPSELRTCIIPPLLIQPLVENAIKHGLEPSREGGEISIEALLTRGNRVRVTVKDTGVGMQEHSAHPGAGIGLENIRKRLDLLFGSRAAMTIEENLPSGVIVTIEVPYETNAGNHR
jgi:sensor histidine kinase YesM